MMRRRRSRRKEDNRPRAVVWPGSDKPISASWVGRQCYASWCGTLPGTLPSASRQCVDDESNEQCPCNALGMPVSGTGACIVLPPFFNPLGDARPWKRAIKGVRAPARNIIYSYFTYFTVCWVSVHDAHSWSGNCGKISWFGKLHLNNKSLLPEFWSRLYLNMLTKWWLFRWC